MNLIKHTTIALIISASVFWGSTAAAASKEDLIAQLETVKKLRTQIPPGFEWRYTGSRIKEAEESLAGDKLTAAEKMIARVHREVTLATEQAQTAAVVWPIAVPK